MENLRQAKQVASGTLRTSEERFRRSDRGYCAIGARKNASMPCKERDELDMKLIQASRAVLAYALAHGPGQDCRRGRLDANERRAREALAIRGSERMRTSPARQEIMR